MRRISARFKGVIIALVALAALGASPAQAQVGPVKCKPIETPTAPKIYDDISFRLQAPSGPLVLRVANATSACTQKYFEQTKQTTEWKQGIVDANGKVLVPAQYDDVVPLTATLFAVRATRFANFKYQPWQLYKAGKGVVGPAPWTGGIGVLKQAIAGHSGVDVPYAFDAPDASNRATYYLFGDGSKPPVVLTEVGGPGTPATSLQQSAYEPYRPKTAVVNPPLEQNGDVIVVSLTAGDGNAVSRILASDGTVISPVLPNIASWSTWTHAEMRAYYKNGMSMGDEIAFGKGSGGGGVTEFIMRAFPNAHPDIPEWWLYLPIDSHGIPLKMPSGAIGVFPIRASIQADAGRRGFGWAVVFKDAKGITIRRGLAPLAKILANPDAYPLVGGIQRFSFPVGGLFQPDVLVEKDLASSRWRVRQLYTLEPHPDGVGLEGNDASEAMALFDGFRAQRWAKQSAERDAVAAKAKSDKLAFEASEIGRLTAAGQMCRTSAEYIVKLGPTALARMIELCPGGDSYVLSMARAYRLDPALIAKVDRGIDANARASYDAMLEQQEKARAYIAAHQSFNWNAYGDAMSQGMTATTDAFITNQRRAYYDNLEKWNRGQQNWGGPK